MNAKCGYCGKGEMQRREVKDVDALEKVEDPKTGKVRRREVVKRGVIYVCSHCKFEQRELLG